MDEKIPIHARLGVTEQRSDEITDAVVAAFQKNGSAREMVEYVNGAYDSESVIAGVALDMIITECVITEED